MPKKVNKTIIERFGFDDKELTTPEHDKMLLWCMDKENLYRMFKKLGIINIKQIILTCQNDRNNLCDWTESNGKCNVSCMEIPKFPYHRIFEIDKYCSEDDAKRLEKKNKEIGEEYYNKRREMITKRKDISEKIISDFNNHKKLTEPTIKKAFFDKCLCNIIAEKAIMGGYDNNYNIGFIDLFASIRKGNFIPFSFQALENKTQIAIEIKPEIKSIGEVIRQINMYRSHMIRTEFVLVTKTRGLKDILSSQNIHVFEYDGGTLNEFNSKRPGKN